MPVIPHLWLLLKKRFVIPKTVSNWAVSSCDDNDTLILSVFPTYHTHPYPRHCRKLQTTQHIPLKFPPIPNSFFIKNSLIMRNCFWIFGCFWSIVYSTFGYPNTTGFLRTEANDVKIHKSKTCDDHLSHGWSTPATFCLSWGNSTSSQTIPRNDLMDR